MKHEVIEAQKTPEGQTLLGCTCGVTDGRWFKPAVARKQRERFAGQHERRDGVTVVR